MPLQKSPARPPAMLTALGSNCLKSQTLASPRGPGPPVARGKARSCLNALPCVGGGPLIARSTARTRWKASARSRGSVTIEATMLREINSIASLGTDARSLPTKDSVPTCGCLALQPVLHGGRCVFSATSPHGRRRAERLATGVGAWQGGVKSSKGSWNVF